ncbi:MAG: HAMP domain-containing protein, partial [Phenylobacterium sp.]
MPEAAVPPRLAGASAEAYEKPELAVFLLLPIRTDAMRPISLQTRLIAFILLLLLVSVGVVAGLGYASARASLKTAALAQLEGVQTSRVKLVSTLLQASRNEVLALSAQPEIGRMSAELRADYRALGDAPPDAATRAAVTAFYVREFAPALSRGIDSTVAPASLLPSSPAGWRAQAAYVATGPRPYNGSQPLAVGSDATAYGRAVAETHARLGEIIGRFGFENILLVDPDTLEVFYSHQTNAALGTSLESGPYAASGLAAVVRDLRRSQNVDDYRMADFEFYRPALGKPRAFIATPVFHENRLVAIMALRLPTDRIEEALSNDGLGRTGEVFLIGPDGKLRTESRFQQEDPKAFVARLRHSSLTTHTVDRIERLGTAVLLAPQAGEASRAALTGRSGVGEGVDYRGEKVFTAYGPVDLDSLRWAVIAQVEQKEALAPVRSYAAQALGAAVGLALLGSLVAIAFAGRIARPISALAAAAERIGRGDSDAEVTPPRDPELRVLGESLNRMVASLRRQKAEAQAQAQESEKLLESLLPASGAAQMREGGHDTPRSFADVTVAFVNLFGLDALAQNLGDEASLSLLSDMVAAFDEAAESLGVEKVR